MLGDAAGRGRRGSRTIFTLGNLAKLVVLLLVTISFFISSTIIVQNTDTLDQRWRERETQWKRLEAGWNKELDNLQTKINNLELVLDSSVLDPRKLDDEHIPPYEVDSRHAIVTSFGGSPERPDWVFAVALFKSLREARSRVPNFIALSFFDGSLPQTALDAFLQLGVEVMPIKADRNPPSFEWYEIWARVQAFSLSQFSRVLYMDCRSFVMENIDDVLNVQDPVDFKGRPAEMVHTALTPYECSFWEPCVNQRNYPSPRMFVIRPDSMVHDTLSKRVMSKGEELHMNDLFNMLAAEVLETTPFPEDRYDGLFGECTCSHFKRMKTISWGCMRMTNLWNDVLGRVWTETDCTHSVFVVWLRLLMNTLEKHER